MRTALRPNELQLLERWLQGELEAETLNWSWQVQCALQQGALMVIGQHPPTIAPDVGQTFAILEQALRHIEEDWLAQLKAAVGQPEELPVQLYLQVVGQPHPYASAQLTVEGAIALSVDESQGGAVDPSTTKPITPAAPEIMLASTSPQATASVQSAELEPDDLDDLPEWLARVPWLAKIPIPALVISTALGFFALGSGLYVLTRPCVIGACVPLETAQQLSQQSAELAQPTASAQDVVMAYQQLLEANYLLSTIPRWSGHYDTAQTLLKSYEPRTATFGQVMTALQIAQTAAEKSQNAPHPVQTWREVQQLWREAITLLETVPADSPVHLWSQRKRGEYEANLGAINHRIRVEQEAQERIEAARDVATVAEAREAAATSVANWKSVFETWQVVVNALKNIPQGTMAYAEAQQLLGIYQPRLAATRDRHTQEEISVDAYNQALSLAERARQAEQRQQWSEAVNQWQNALTNVEQVPSGTSYHGQAQPLVTTYQTALASAQDHMRAATVVQSATSSLGEMCAATSTICTYTVQPNAIQVQLTTDYDWAVEAVIANAPLTGDRNTQAALKSYVDTLLQRFSEVSNQAQLPLDLYNADGRLFGTYDPQIGGYVRR